MGDGVVGRMGRSDRKLRYLLQDGAIKESDLGWRVAGVWCCCFVVSTCKACACVVDSLRSHRYTLRMDGNRMKGLVQYKP
jgi:hypothetical protein